MTILQFFDEDQCAWQDSCNADDKRTLPSRYSESWYPWKFIVQEIRACLPYRKIAMRYVGCDKLRCVEKHRHYGWLKVNERASALATKLIGLQHHQQEQKEESPPGENNIRVALTKHIKFGHQSEANTVDQANAASS